MSSKDLIQRAWEQSDPKLSWAHGKATRKFLPQLGRRDLPPDVILLLDMVEPRVVGTAANDDDSPSTSSGTAGPSCLDSTAGTSTGSGRLNNNESFEASQNPYTSVQDEDEEDNSTVVIVDETEDSDAEFEYVYED